MSDTRCFLRFAGYLAGLLESGMPLQPALRTMADNDDCGRRTAAVSGKVLYYMERGYSFSSALSVNGLIHVDERFCSYLSAAENGSCMAAMLRFLASSETDRREYLTRLAGICVYPLAVVDIGAFGSLFLVRNHELLGFMNAPDNGLFLIISATLTFIMAFVVFLRIGIKKSFRSRQSVFLKSMAFFLSCGFDLKHTLSLTSMTGNLKLASLCVMLQKKMASGTPFSESLKESGIFQKETVAFIKMAEASGKLADCCKAASDRLEKSSEDERGKFLRFGEPLLLVGTGLYVLVLAEGVLLPFLMDFSCLL